MVSAKPMVSAEPKPKAPRRRRPALKLVPKLADSDFRSRLLSRGAQALSEAELVAVLIGQGESGLSRAQELVSACGGVAGLLHCDLSITRAQELDDVQSAAVLAAVEISRRLVAPIKTEALEDPAIAARYLYLRHARVNQEVFGALFLDFYHRLKGEAVFFRGIHCRVFVEPQPILREAIRCNAHAVLLFHTHPSGDPSPSREDWAFTHRMRDACDLIGLDLVDHLVLGGDRWISLRRMNPW